MQGLISDETMTNIGDAIREKLHTSVKYTPDQMPDAIRSISAKDYVKYPGDVLDIIYLNREDGIYDIVSQVYLSNTINTFTFISEVEVN